MAKGKKSNFEVLEENRKAALSFADTVLPRQDVDVINTGDKLKQAAESVETGDLTAAIRMLDQIKDNKIGIVWHESPDLGNGTKALVRDARGVTTDKQALKVDAGEKYAMQVLNEVRAGIDLIDKADIDPDAKELAKKKLMHVASKSIENIDNLPNNIKQYNTRIVDVLEQAGIEDVSKKLIFAKEVANFKDEHNHIVTLTTAKDSTGKLHTVTEAEIMLNGLTPAQKNQWEAIAKTSKDDPKTKLSGMEWYNNMPPYKQDLLREVAADVATGNKVIPTQLLSDVPGIKNAYQKVTAVKGPEQTESTVISQTLHCGTPATKIKITDKTEKQGIVDEQVKQLQTFVPPGEAVNLNILTSKTPLNFRGEDFIQDQLTKTAKNVENVKTSASPVNRWQVFGGGRDHSEFRDTLKDIGNDLAKNKDTQNVGKFLKNGSSILENLGEKLSFGRYKSTETRAKEEIAKLDYPQLGNVLKEAMNARNLVDSSTNFTRGNVNLKVGAAMNIVESAVKLETGPLHAILDKETTSKVSNRVDFCKSGKDRTGYLQTKNTHEAVSNYLGVNPRSELGKKNMLSQVSAGHTQEMAGIQGGSVGCHSVKTNPEFGLSSDPQDQVISGVINQKSSHFNSKVKVSEKNVDGIIEDFEKGFKAQEASRSVSTRPRSSEVVKSVEPKMAERSETRSRSETISEGVVKPDSTPPVKKAATRERSNSI
jgi:hypothetical protein